jgi:FkbM family methyltransferase
MKLVRYASFARQAALRMSRIFIPQARPTVRQVSLNGMQMLVMANEDVGREIYFFHKYESLDVAYLRSAIRPSDICFDVGANTGFFSIVMGACALEGRVYAFEPIPLNYHLLSANVLLNGLPVDAYEVAVSDKVGEALFSQSEDSAYSSLVAVGRRPEVQKITVPTISLAEFASREGIRRIDVMKIDVEGAEQLVLEGAAEILARSTMAPRLLMVELYDANLAPYGSSIAQIVRLVQSFGYQPFVVQPGGCLSAFGPQHYNRHYNVFFLRSSK